MQEEKGWKILDLRFINQLYFDMLYHPISVTFLTCNKYVPEMTICQFHF